jgi:hypothetical protein
VEVKWKWRASTKQQQEKMQQVGHSRVNTHPLCQVRQPQKALGERHISSRRLIGKNGEEMREMGEIS